jgi:hypothetical protein
MRSARWSRLAARILFVALTLGSSGLMLEPRAGGATTSRGATAASHRRPLLYVSQQNAYEVLIYDENVRHGLPVGKITNGIVLAYGIATDAAENLYVANANATVTMYPRGKRSPSRTYYRGANSASSLAVGNDGTLYAGEIGSSQDSRIVVYPPGSLKPSRVLRVPSLYIKAIAVDAANDIYAAGYFSKSDVVEIPAGSNVATSLGLAVNEPAGLAVAADGALVVSDYATPYRSPEVAVFPPGSTTPSRTFGKTGCPGQIAFSSNGEVLFVADPCTNVAEGYRYADGALVKIFASGMLGPYGVAVSPPAPAGLPFMR